MANTFGITCPANCAAATLGALPEDYCQLTPKQSEIDVVIFEGTDGGPASMASGTDWTALLDNTDATGTAAKFLIGSGTIAESEPLVTPVARFAEYVTSRLYTLVFTVFELSDTATYDFLRKLQCGSIVPKIYYQSNGGFIYGKINAATDDEGIQLNDITVSMPKDAGREATDRAVITMRWYALTDPDRAVSPLAL